MGGASSSSVGMFFVNSAKNVAITFGLFLVVVLLNGLFSESRLINVFLLGLMVLMIWFPRKIQIIAGIEGPWAIGLRVMLAPVALFPLIFSISPPSFDNEGAQPVASTEDKTSAVESRVKPDIQDLVWAGGSVRKFDRQGSLVNKGKYALITADIECENYWKNGVLAETYIKTVGKYESVDPPIGPGQSRELTVGSGSSSIRAKDLDLYRSVCKPKSAKWAAVNPKGLPIKVFVDVVQEADPLGGSALSVSVKNLSNRKLRVEDVRVSCVFEATYATDTAEQLRNALVFGEEVKETEIEYDYHKDARVRARYSRIDDESIELPPNGTVEARLYRDGADSEIGAPLFRAVSYKHCWISDSD